MYFMYKFFCTLDQADTEETKILKDNHEQIFMKEIKHVQQGLLSDPPGDCEIVWAARVLVWVQIAVMNTT